MGGMIHATMKLKSCDTSVPAADVSESEKNEKEREKKKKTNNKNNRV